MKIYPEKGFYIFLDIILLFMLINFSSPLATIYALMSIIGWIMYYDTSFISYPIDKKGSSWALAFIWAGVIYIAFILVSSKIFTSFGVAEYAQVSSIVTLVATTNPAFASSMILTFVAFGMLIPIIETTFWSRLTEWLGYAAKTTLSFNFLNLKLWAIILVSSGIFGLFHATSKGVTNNSALIVTVIFMVISIWMILFFGEIKQAILLHILSNSVAIGSQYGWLSVSNSFPYIGLGIIISPIYILGGVILVFYLLRKNRVGVFA